MFSHLPASTTVLLQLILLFNNKSILNTGFNSKHTIKFIAFNNKFNNKDKYKRMKPNFVFI